MLRIKNKEYYVFEHGHKIWLFDTIEDLTRHFVPYAQNIKSKDKSAWDDFRIIQIKRRGNKWEGKIDDRIYLEMMYQAEKLGIRGF